MGYAPQGTVGGFRNQFIYRKALQLVSEIMDLTRHFPKEETFGLQSQMRRAATSISSNIAEGYRRSSTKEYIKFLAISYASCGELQSHTDVALTMELISEQDHKSIMEMEEEMARLLWTTMEKLKMKAHGARRMAQGEWRKAHGARRMAQGLRHKV